ncbi:MAG: DNA polymerase III subunit beta [Atopobiaceae bacterium]|nr:DNA polymerase III subunit beta [Atopobiaceae bacterium]
MKFTVSQSALAKALLVVTKGMATNSTLPILSGIYIKAADGELEFQATNLTNSIRHKIAANVEDEGETVVSGKILSNIVKTLPDAAVTFEGLDRIVAITCGKSHFRLNTLDPRDFPEFPQYALERSIELPSALLSEMVDKVYKVTSKDTSRPILGGVLLSVEENVIRLVATDSYRLAVCDSNVETSSAEEAFRTIVPGGTFHDVLALPSMTDTVLVGTTASQVVFSFGNTTYISRKIEGNFPNYRQLLPASCNTAVTIDTAEFAAALKRVSVIALANPSVRFDIDADGKVMRLSASSPDQGESTELLPVEVEGDSMSIALNYHYVFDCVNAVSSRKELTLELQSTMQPGIFKSYDKVNYLYLLMPVRM